MLSVRQGLNSNGGGVPTIKRRPWLCASRGTTYYKTAEGTTQIKAKLLTAVKEKIEAEYS